MNYDPYDVKSIFYQQSKVTHEEFALIELMIERESVLRRVNDSIREVNDRRVPLDDDQILKTFQLFNALREVTIRFLRTVSLWQASFTSYKRPQLFGIDYLASKFLTDVNTLSAAKLRKVFNFQFFRGNVLLLPFVSLAPTAPLRVNGAVGEALRQFSQPNEEAIIECYQILLNCLPDEIYQHKLAPLGKWLRESWTPNVFVSISVDGKFFSGEESMSSVLESEGMVGGALPSASASAKNTSGNGNGNGNGNQCGANGHGQMNSAQLTVGSGRGSGGQSPLTDSRRTGNQHKPIATMGKSGTGTGRGKATATAGAAVLSSSSLPRPRPRPRPLPGPAPSLSESSTASATTASSSTQVSLSQYSSSSSRNAGKRSSKSSKGKAEAEEEEVVDREAVEFDAYLQSMQRIFAKSQLRPLSPAARAVANQSDPSAGAQGVPSEEEIYHAKRIFFAHLEKSAVDDESAPQAAANVSSAALQLSSKKAQAKDLEMEAIAAKEKRREKRHAKGKTQSSGRPESEPRPQSASGAESGALGAGAGEEVPHSEHGESKANEVTADSEDEEDEEDDDEEWDDFDDEGEDEDTSAAAEEVEDTLPPVITSSQKQQKSAQAQLQRQPSSGSAISTSSSFASSALSSSTSASLPPIGSHKRRKRGKASGLAMTTSAMRSWFVKEQQIERAAAEALAAKPLKLF